MLTPTQLNGTLRQEEEVLKPYHRCMLSKPRSANRKYAHTDVEVYIEVKNANTCRMTKDETLKNSEREMNRIQVIKLISTM